MISTISQATSQDANLDARLQPFINYEIRPQDWWGVRLERVEAFFHLLGDPQQQGRWIHLAGTKGKGSTAAMLDSVFRQAGFHTGLYTSPHLVHLNERIRVDGGRVAEAFLTDLWDACVAPAAEAYHAGEEQHWGALTYFEVLTGLALCAFRARGIEWGVLETGVGGRLDATNLVQPQVTIITRIDYDHQKLLGSTLTEIAGEKAGIIKPGVPCVSPPQPPEAHSVLEKVAAERGAPLLFVAEDALRDAAATTRIDLQADPPCQRFELELDDRTCPVRLPLLGRHQHQNAAVALTAVETLREAGMAGVTDEAILEGLAAVRWPGRFQVWQREPWIVLDGAHNPGSAAALRATLEEVFPGRRVSFLLALAKDKDWSGIARALGPAQAVVTRAEPVARMGDPVRIAEVLRDAGWQARAVGGLAQAWREATAGLRPEDVLCVTGSVMFTGAVMAYFGWEAFPRE